jgi:hypothetical protein
MISQTVRSIVLLGGLTLVVAGLARAEGETGLAAALNNAKATLQNGLKASEVSGIPISAKFEIEDGKLQLSVYVLDAANYAEVVVDAVTGAVIKTEKMTDGGDLKEAAAENGAMAKATVPLVAAVDLATKANAGYRAVSVSPQLKDGHPVAEVTLLQGTTFKKVIEKLD